MKDACISLQHDSCSTLPKPFTPLAQPQPPASKEAVTRQSQHFFSPRFAHMNSPVLIPKQLRGDPHHGLLCKLRKPCLSPSFEIMSLSARAPVCCFLLLLYVTIFTSSLARSLGLSAIREARWSRLRVLLRKLQRPTAQCTTEMKNRYFTK